MFELVKNGIQPIPPELAAPELVGWLFTIWAGGFGIAVIPWAIYRFVKHNDDIPLWMILGGLICSLLEPFLDYVGHLWWPTNLPGPAFIGYGVHVPWLIPTCYVFFISMTGYWAYTRMKAGLTLKGMFIVWALIASTDIIMEMPGTALGAYVYYGDASFKVLGFPLAWGWLNGTSMFAVGALLFAVEPHLKGLNRIWLALVSISAMGATYGMVAWPYFMSLNWEMPWIASRLLTLFSLFLCVVLVRFLAAAIAVEEDEAARSALKGKGTLAAA